MVEIERTFMVQPTFQREWVDGRGFWLVLAFFMGGLGGGLYLMSLYFDYYPGLITGFLIVAVGKSTAHLLDTSRPWRFWRGFLRFQTSWISRGLIALAIFVVFSGLQLAPTISILSWLPWSSTNVILTVLATFGAVVVIGYPGFMLGVAKGIPFWKSSLTPLVFMVYALLGGAGLMLGMLSLWRNGTINMDVVQSVLVSLLIVGALLLGAHLWGTHNSNVAGRRSVALLIRGKVSPYFVGGSVLLGLLTPITIVAYSLVNGVPAGLLTVTGMCVLGGMFLHNYSVLKAGIYSPII